MNKSYPATAITSFFRCGLFFLISFSVSIQAQDQIWIQSNLNNEWNLTAPNWDSGVVWINNNNAIFGGLGETVELGGNLTVGNLTFNGNGYILEDTNDDGTLTLSGPSTITVTTDGHTATIREAIAQGSFIKAGAGTLALTGNNLFDGTVSVTAGRLSLGSWPAPEV